MEELRNTIPEKEQFQPDLNTISARPIRNYKDRIFRMIYREKGNFLELYNALNGTHYDNPKDLVVTILENAIYLNLKNDVSYILYDKMTLYEHQSTINPNMPLRNLFYVTSLYSRLTRDENLFDSSLIEIPEPQFVVFYNGTEELPERSEWKLSDAYGHFAENPALELKTLVLNINPGYNQQLLDNCKTLKDYMIFVEKVRRYRQELSLSDAVERAVSECMREDVMADFLRKNKTEVIHVSILEYDEEYYIQLERKCSKKIGMFLKLFEQIRRKMAKGIPPEEIAEILEEDREDVELFCELITENPALDDEKLYGLWSRERNRRKYARLKALAQRQ